MIAEIACCFLGRRLGDEIAEIAVISGYGLEDEIV